MSESGFPDFEAYAWWGIFAPAGTPKPIVERFGNEMAACLRDERVAKQLIETQQVSLTLGGTDVLRKFVANQMQVWGKVVKDNDIKADGRKKKRKKKGKDIVCRRTERRRRNVRYFW